MNKPSNKDTMLYILIAILTVGLYYVLYMGNATDLKKYEKTIDSAQVQIDSLEVEVKKSDVIIDSLKVEVVKLDSTNYVLREKIYYIRKENEEKINAVDHYNVSDLNKFFADRYPQNR